MYQIVDGNVIRTSDGKVVAPCQSTDDPDYLAYVAWVEAGNTPQTIILNQASAEPKIKVGAFRERLGLSAKVNIEMACIDNPAAPVEQRMLAAKLRVMKDDLSNYTHVDLSRADLKANLNQLKSYNIITQADIDRMYAPPFRDEELWHG